MTHNKNILLTSFTTWLPHQKSNSSDDLLIEIAQIHWLPHSLTFLRQLPVDIQLASTQVIEQINHIQPDVIICSGMAEKRLQLSIESNATFNEHKLTTNVNLQQLIGEFHNVIEISHDCGKFVCEGLYYSVLDYLYQKQLNIPCIFVHIPLLTPQNLSQIVTYFAIIIKRLPFLNNYV